jgi:hypothetical protein
MQKQRIDRSISINPAAARVANSTFRRLMADCFNRINMIDGCADHP